MRLRAILYATEVDDEGNVSQRVVGELIWDGKRIEPSNDEARWVLKRDAVVPKPDVNDVELVSPDEGERFMRCLAAAYTGTYFRIGLVEEGDQAEEHEEPKGVT